MMFEWQQQGNLFIATFPNGRAVITERRRKGFGVPIGGEYAYDARLEDAAGIVLDSISDESSFENAEEWVVAVLPAHRRHFYADSRVALLQRCQRLFDPEREAPFVERLEEIIGWLSSGRELDLVRAPALEAIQWIEADQGWIASGPADLDLLIIARTVTASRYRAGARDQQFWPKIRHHSGATWRSHYSFSELSDAQGWIAEQIALLHAPGLDKATLPAIEFTLQICQHFMQNEGAPIGILDDLASRLSERYL
jgi:hypothetical protein